MRISEDVLIKVGYFYMPVDFVILHMAEDAYAQVILGRPSWPLRDANLMLRRVN